MNNDDNEINSLREMVKELREETRELRSQLEAANELIAMALKTTREVLRILEIPLENGS
jgi:hypothetical protein